jgi:hypothetical protein
VIRAKIVKFGAVCNRFCKALVDMGEEGQVWTLVQYIKPNETLFEKGQEVDYEHKAGRMYRGHLVHGQIYPMEEAHTDETLSDAADWGLK